MIYYIYQGTNIPIYQPRKEKHIEDQGSNKENV